MERPLLRTLVILALVAVLTSCGGSGAIIQVLRGNLAYDRGEYQSALVHYMTALGDEASGAWVQFNIGNVYYALGEHEAALRVWQEARDTVSGETGAPGRSALDLIHATSYNRGVLLYQQGRYAPAYEEFRYALSVNNRSTAAKANLEIALRKLQAAEAASAGEPASGAGGLSETPPPGGEEEGPGDQTLRILEYVRRKEARQWFANRDAEQQAQSQDW